MKNICQSAPHAIFYCYRARGHDVAGQPAQVPLAGEAGERGDWGRSQTHHLVVVMMVIEVMMVVRVLMVVIGEIRAAFIQICRC